MLIEVTLIFMLCATYWLWSHFKSKPDEPPPLPGAWPVLGHIPLLISDSCSFWNKVNTWGKQTSNLGGVSRFQVGSKPIYLVTDPIDMLTIANNCLEKSEYYEFGRPMFGEGLITSKASIWKKNRKLLSPAFSQTVLDTFMGIFNNQARNMVKNMAKEVDKGPFDHLSYVILNNSETVCLTALGTDIPNVQLIRDYAHLIDLLKDTVIQRIIKVWWHSPHTFRFSNLKKEQDRYIKLIHNLSDMISKRKNNDTKTELKNKPGGIFKPFMELLLELMEKDMVNDKFVKEHVDTILAAAIDTTTTTVVIIMLLLGSHSEVQEKVVDELKNIIGDEDRDICKQDLSKLVYLEAVIKESLRLYVPVPVVARMIDRDIKLRNCTLYAGETCTLFLFAVNRHPIWGPDRDEFCPERWLDPSRLPDYNMYASFSVGKRNCIGKSYAFMSMKTTLAHIIRNYRITADDSQLRLKLDITLTPESGYFISIHKRTSL